jgi:excisionase family DNA binding protein
MVGRLRDRSRRVWLTTAEFAEAAGVEADTVRKWVYRGHVRARKFKGRWRVLASEVGKRQQTSDGGG